jgi:predicted transcriptional regulator
MQANTVNKEKVADLVLNKGITQEQAAELTGCTQGRISQIIKELRDNPEYIGFKEKKDSLLEHLQARIYKNVNDSDIEKASLQQKIISMSVLQDKIQVMRGQATEIIDYRSLSLTGTLRELRDARARAIDQQKVINNKANEQAVDITNDIA